MDAQVAKVETAAREKARRDHEEEKRQLQERMEEETRQLQTQLMIFQKVRPKEQLKSPSLTYLCIIIRANTNTDGFPAEQREGRVHVARDIKKA